MPRYSELRAQMPLRDTVDVALGLPICIITEQWRCPFYRPIHPGRKSGQACAHHQPLTGCCLHPQGKKKMDDAA